MIESKMSGTTTSEAHVSKSPVTAEPASAPKASEFTPAVRIWIGTILAFGVLLVVGVAAWQLWGMHQYQNIGH